MNMIDVHIDGVIYAEVPLGGISRMCSSIINRLPDHNCRVHLYLPRAIRHDLVFDPRVKIIKYPSNYRLRPGRLFNPLTEFLYRRRVDRMWSKARTGVFYSTHFTTNSQIRLPQVVTVHDLFHECLPDCFSENQLHPFSSRRRKCVEAADAIVCDSESTRADLRRIFGERDVPSRVVQLAVDGRFRRLSRENVSSNAVCEVAEGHLYVLYVGTRFPYKNFAGLLAGFACWSGRDTYRLVVIGKSATHAEKAQLRAYGLTDRVLFRGPLSDDDLIHAYNGASAVVIPSLSEGFGLPLWEAMACGVPVVAARAGALPEIGGDVPVYFDFGSPQLLTEALAQAVAIPRDSPRLVRGVQLATARTWDDVTREYVEVYRRLLATPRTEGRQV